MMQLMGMSGPTMEIWAFTSNTDGLLPMTKENYYD